MQVQSDISFKSKFKCVNSSEFGQLYKLSREVGRPWTIETMQTGKNLSSTFIGDCFVGGITNGEDTALFHLATRDEATAKRQGVKAFNIENIKKVLSERYDLTRENLHGILFGGWSGRLNPDGFGIPDKTKEFNELRELFKEYNIPVSVICQRVYKQCKSPMYYGLLYREAEDTFYITNTATHEYHDDSPDSKYEVEFHPDGVEYYEYTNDGTGKTKAFLRKASVEDYLRSRFDVFELRNGDYFD